MTPIMVSRCAVLQYIDDDDYRPVHGWLAQESLSRNAKGFCAFPTNISRHPNP